MNFVKSALMVISVLLTVLTTQFATAQETTPEPWGIEVGQTIETEIQLEQYPSTGFVFNIWYGSGYYTIEAKSELELNLTMEVLEYNDSHDIIGRRLALDINSGEESNPRVTLLLETQEEFEVHFMILLRSSAAGRFEISVTRAITLQQIETAQNQIENLCQNLN